MPSPKLVPLLLTDAEREGLGALARWRKASQALAERAPGGWHGGRAPPAPSEGACQAGGVTESSGSSGLIRRLLAHRGLDVSALTGTGGPGFLAALDDPEVTPAVLGQLARVLGLHLPDLYVMAGIPVPEELAPLDDRSGTWVDSLVNAACRVSPQSLERLLALARGLPQQDRTRPVPVPRPYEEYPPGFGGVLLRMIRNRNLGWVAAAKTLCLLGGSHPMSASTVGMLGRGRKGITPRLLADFAAVLGIDAGDLAAMNRMELPPGDLPVHPCAPEMAGLIWEARRLTYEQVRHLVDEVKSAHWK